MEFTVNFIVQEANSKILLLKNAKIAPNIVILVPPPQTV